MREKRERARTQGSKYEGERGVCLERSTMLQEEKIENGEEEAQ